MADDEPRASEDAFALAPMQEGMLFHSLRRAGVEVQQVLMRGEAPLDVERLGAAWRWVVRRHPALRTSFDWSGAEHATQRAWPELEGAPVEVEALEGPLEERLGAWLTSDRLRERPLDRPFGGLTLLRAPDGEVLVWTHHHAHVDGRSIEIVLGDLWRRYDEGDGYAPDPAPTMRRHVDALEAQDTEASVAHFVAALEGVTEATPLPGRRRADEAGEGATRERTDVVPPETVRALRALGEEHGFTLANAVQLAWAIVLGRYGYTRDVVFGVTRSGRYVAEDAADVVGCLINTIPLRVRLDAERTAVELLGELRRTAVAARPHEGAPLSAIRNAVGVEALFHTVVVHEGHVLDEIMDARRPEGAPRRRYELRSRSETPITLALYERRGDRLDVVVEHREDQVEAEIAASLGRRVARLLEQIARRPEALLRELRVTTEEEVRPMRSGAPMPPLDGDLAGALRRAAGANPGGVALRDLGTGRELDYARMLGAAGALASAIRERGVEPGEVVAVHAPVRAETAVAFWATQLAGVIYLPVDPGYPEERVAYLLEDSGARLLLVPPDAEPASGSLPTLPIDLDASSEPPEPARAETSYMIYTSGSTGRPKGVRVHPRSLMAHAVATHREYGLTHHDRVLAFASPSFDVSLEEMVPTHLAGAELVVRDEAMARAPGLLCDRVAERSVSVLQLPTAFFNELVHELTDSGRVLPACVRMTIIGGERASAAACRRFREAHPRVCLVNAYGPTEVTITSIAHRVGAPEAIAHEVPIGRPFGATFARVLDVDRWPVPRGGRGQLALGGPQVARGYHGRDELTAERFVDDPAPPGEGRVYLTGDLAHEDRRGDLVYDGRVDDQVKIRGYRIELGEIEAALLADRRVAEAAVVVRTEGAEKSLAAFARAQDPALSPEALRAHLADRLPGYMVPAAIELLDQLPTTPGGKVDRRALARRPLTPREAPKAADSDPTVRAVTEIFAEVLGKVVDEDADFFDHGGHSLRAIRLGRAIERALGVKIGAGSIFAHRTPRALAALIGRSREAGPPCELFALNEAPSGPTPLYCVLGVDLYRPLAEELGERPVLGVYVPDEDVVGRDDGPLATEALAEAYLEAITHTTGEAPRMIGGFSYGGVVALEMAQQLRDRGRTPDLLVLLDPILPEMDQRGGLDILTNFLHRARYQADEIPARIWRRVQGLVGNPGGAEGDGEPDPERRAWLEREAAYTEALYDYAPRMRPYDGRALLYVSRDRLPARLEAGIERWRQILGPFVHVELIGGDHDNVVRRPGVTEVVSSLADVLGRRASVVPGPSPS